MSNTAWLSYLVSVIYGTILVGCMMGIRNNMIRKRDLMLANEYEKKKRVIRWRNRFYLTLFSAIFIRITTLISAVILNKTMVLSKSTNQQEFIWSFVASIASMLFFSAFSFIIWFFAHLAFLDKPQVKNMITPFFTTLNVAIYISTFSIGILFVHIVIDVFVYCIHKMKGISSVASSSWDLLYDYELPLFVVAGWILAICFLYLTVKISSSIQRERHETFEYREQSRRASSYNSPHHSPLMGSNRHQNRSQGGAHYGGNDEVSVSKSRRILSRHEPPPTLQNNNVQMDLSQSPVRHIMPRLIKLSLLCALCWIVRGFYLMSVRIWISTDKTPFGIPELAWEAIFYCLMEYPPSLSALVLMIARPKPEQATDNKSQYPKAVSQDY